MKKLIIENRSDMPMCIAVNFAQMVVAQGKISESGGKPQYSHHTAFGKSHDIFAPTGKSVHASSIRNAKSDRIIIHHNDGKDWQK